MRIEKIIEITEFTSVTKSPSTQDLFFFYLNNLVFKLLKNIIKAIIPSFEPVFSHSVIPWLLIKFLLHNKKYNILNFTKVSQEPLLAEKYKFELIIVFLIVEWSPPTGQEIVDAIVVSEILNFSLFILILYSRLLLK